MMRYRKFGARAEHRLLEGRRTQESANLSNKFQQLKSLTVDLDFYSPEEANRKSHIKYTVDLANAKSVFRFDCPNAECVGGDFDLTEELANAVAAQRMAVTGKVCCQGWRRKSAIDRLHCHHVLRFTFNLVY